MMIFKRNNLFYLIVIPLFFFLFINLVSAQEVVVRQGVDFDLKRPCFNNGTFCSSSAVCNITIVKPNGDLLIGATDMTHNPTYYNVTIPANDTEDVIGIHKAIMACRDGTLNGDDTFDLLVSPSGNDDNSLSNILLLSFGFLFSFGIIIFGVKHEDIPITLLGTFALFFLGLYTLMNGVGNIRNNMTMATSIIMLGISSYISLKASVELINA